MKKNIAKALGQMEDIMAGPVGKTDRTLAKQEKIRQAGLAEDRMIYAILDREQYCLDQLDELGDNDGED